MVNSRVIATLLISSIFLATPTRPSDNSNPNWCGNKHKNLVILNTALAGMPDVSVPEFIGITSQRIEEFLRTNEPTILNNYQRIIRDLNNGQNCENDLATIQAAIQNAFSVYSFTFTQDELVLFERIESQKKFFMVRSTGIEDSQTVANAGGNVSVAYVYPDIPQVQKALGQVVASYFGMQSLKNRLAGGEQLSATLCLPGLIQLLIGEPLNGSNSAREIPVSGVAFTTNQSLSAPNFAITEINASYGHGEGIVANRVVADRYYVTASRTQPETTNIYPMIYKKEFRLVPTQNRQTGTYALAECKNNPAAASASALTTQQINHLYTVLKTIERSYGQPMDVEFVFLDDHLYIVQARPAMHHAMTPCYCDLEILADGDISEPLDATTLVTGKASLLVITNPADVIITKTLDEADQMPNSATCKAVIVGAWASSLSHAAVNFISHGTPCMYVHDFNALKKLVSQISPANPLVIDPQRRIVCLWQNSAKTIATATRQGWFEHPIDRTLSLFTQTPTLLPTHANPMPQDGKLIALLDSFKTATTAGQQKNILDVIAQRVTNRFSLTERRIASVGHLCPQSFKNSFAEFKQQFERVITQAHQAIAQSADHFELLFYHKMLEALLFQSNDTRTVSNAYTYSYFLDDLFANNGLFIQQRRLGTNLFFTQEFTYDRYCPSKELAQQWREFLAILEVHAKGQDQSFYQEAAAFKAMLADYNQLESLPLWFATEFYTAIIAHNTFQSLPSQDKLAYTRALITQWTQAYKPEHRTFVHNLQLYKTSISRINTKRGTTFNSQVDADNVTQDIINEVVTPMTSAAFIKSFKEAPLLIQMIACDTMRGCIDTLDTTIKTIKTSYGLSGSDKKRLFVTLLGKFHDVCQIWLKNIMPENALKYHYSWPLNTYLQKMCDQYNSVIGEYNMSLLGRLKKYYRIAEQILMGYYPYDPQPALNLSFQRSKNFSVNAAMLGSSTAYERHYPETAEDMFMLIHQNSLVAVAATYGHALSKAPLEELIYLPDQLKQAIAYVESNECAQLLGSRQATRIGIEYTTDTITILYNMALSNHSSTFQIIYNQTTQQCTLSVQFLGEARSRWEQVAILGNLSHDLSGLEAVSDVILDIPAGFVSCNWVIKDMKSLNTIVKYLASMASISFGGWVNTSCMKYVYPGPESAFAHTARQALNNYVKKHGSNNTLAELLRQF